jgi:uncharacterized Zn finger protein
LTLFNERDLRHLAGRARFDRGRRLLDAVDGVDEDEFSLWAYVHDDDDQPYLAIVHHRVGELGAECDCPDAENGVFCEHAVAAGLAYLSW